MNERRYDPLSGQRRTVVAGLPTPDAGESCRFCELMPATDASPGEARVIMVLDQSLESSTGGPAAAPAPGVGLYASYPDLVASELVGYPGPHGTTLADLDPAALTRLIEVWADRYAVLSGRPEVAYISLSAQAAPPSRQHACCWLHGYPDLPPLVARELLAGAAWLAEHGTCVSCHVLRSERGDRARVVVANRSFLAHVPFAPRFPYEVHVAPYRHATTVLELSDLERADFADVLAGVLRAYREVSESAGPLVLSLRQAPAQDESWLPVSHLRAELTPCQAPADVGGCAGVDGAGIYRTAVAPEQAAAQLRAAAGR
ncbi:MAG: hypothetical protein M3042_10440 [Actinomycetota bacterium]|nr:hypothetical protein [Actinomycetota bacterium]